MFRNSALQVLTQENSHFEEAVDLARACVSSAASPADRLSSRIDLAFALCLMGRDAEAGSLIDGAVRDARDAFEGTSEEDRAWLVEAAIATMAGNDAAAHRRLSRLVARLRDRPLPDDMLSRASFAHANTLLALGERDEALHWLQVSEAANPGDDAGTRRRLKTLLSRSMLAGDAAAGLVLAQEAVRGWEELCGRDDLDRGEALFVLAQLEEARSDKTEAEATFREARRIYEQAPGLWVRPIANCTWRIANLVAWLGRHEEALDEWNRVLPLLEPDDPRRNDVLRAIRELEEEVAKAGPPDVATSLIGAAGRRHAEMVATIEEMREAASRDDFDAVEARATLLLGDGVKDGAAGWDPSMSVRFAMEAPDLVPEVRRTRAAARQRSGRLLEAWVDAMVADEVSRDRGLLAPDLSGRVDELRGSITDGAMASQAYRQVEHLAMGLVLEPAQAGVLEPVADALSSWAPGDPVFLFGLGLARHALGALEEAARLFARVAEIAPSALAPDVRLSRVLGAIGAGANRIVEAQARALRKMDGFPADDLDRRLATMSGTLVRSQFVREHFLTLLGAGLAEEALDVARGMLQDDEAFGHLACGFALARLGRQREAIAAYTRAIDTHVQEDSEDLTDRAHYGRACALALTGHTDRAIADLAVAIEHNPGLARSAIDDDDFLDLRANPSFARIVGQAS
jgi:tetratricopeptide (TPR) repeat protein